MIDAAIVGLGRWGQTLVAAVQGKSDKLRFTRAVSRNPERMRDIAVRSRLELVGDLAAVLTDRAIDAVELGRLLHLEAHFSNEVAGTFSEWRYSLDESPAGGMTGTGIHMLDVLVALAGPVRRVQTLLVSRKPPPDPHDSLSALLEFTSGVSGTLAMVRSTPPYFRLHAFARSASAEVLGRTDLVLRRGGAEPQHLSFPPVDSVRANLESFADAVAGVAPYPIRTGEILDTVAAFDAIAKAAKSGEPVRQV